MHVLTLAELHQRFDGPVPRGEAEAAAHTAPGTRAARTAGQPQLKPHVVLGRMAAAIVEAVKDRGACTEADLLSQGFTADQIRAYGDRAKAMAAPGLPADRQVA